MAENGEIHWFAPLVRGIIPVNENFHIPHGLKKTLKKNPYRVTMDTAFRDVMKGCAQRDETWIDDVILESYCHLHELGYGHSVECWSNDGLQGGLYGVRLGRAFFGESMCSRQADASKVALVHLVEWMRQQGDILLDTQWMTDHLRQFGGFEVSREDYLKLLAEALAEDDQRG